MGAIVQYLNRINMQEPVQVWYLLLKVLEEIEEEIVWWWWWWGFPLPAPKRSAELKKKKKEAIAFFYATICLAGGLFTTRVSKQQGKSSFH